MNSDVIKERLATHKAKEIQNSEDIIEPSETTLAHQSYNDVAANTSIEDVSESVDKKITPSGIASKNESPDEVAEEICAGDALIIYRSWMSLLPLILGALILTFIIFLVSALVLTNGDHVPFNAIFIPITLFAVILHKRYNAKYMITLEGVFVVRGILGMEVRRVRVPYSKIREFELRKSLINRILFLDDADIYISTMLFDEPEIRMAGFPNPVFYVTLLRLMQRRLLAVAAADTDLNKSGMQDSALAP